MKDQLKIAFILLAGVFLSAVPLLPANPTTSAMLAAVAKKKAAGGVTYLSNWDGDNASGVKYINYANGVSEKAVSFDSGGGATFSTTDIQIVGTNVYSMWPISSRDLFNDAEGTLYYTLSFTDGGDEALINNGHFEFADTQYGDTYYMYVTYVSSVLQIDWEDGDGSPHTLTGATLAWDGTYRVGVSWKISTNSLAISAVAVGSSPSWTDGTSLSLQAWGTAPGTMKVGDHYGGTGSTNDTSHLSDIIITNTFKDTDPLE